MNDYKSIPMPAGYTENKNANGESYFINHNTKTTQWEDPRLGKLIILLTIFLVDNISYHI